MTPETAHTIIRELIAILRRDLEEPAGLALAAEACAERGSVGKAIEIANEVDCHAHDANRVLGTIALIKRRYLLRGSALDLNKDSGGRHE